jgi:hypothetical protein
MDRFDLCLYAALVDLYRRADGRQGWLWDYKGMLRSLRTHTIPFTTRTALASLIFISINSPFLPNLSSRSPLIHSIFSQLAQQQIPNHLPSSNIRRPPQRREIQRTRKSCPSLALPPSSSPTLSPRKKKLTISIPKPQHGRNPAPSILQRKAPRLHLILLYVSPFEMMDTALGVPFKIY